MKKADYQYVIVIAARPEKIWQGLTSAEFTEQYWHATRVKSDWQVGSSIVFMVDGENDEEVGCEGKILVAEKPDRLSYSWCFPRMSGPGGKDVSRVTFTLEPCPGGTKLTLIHDQFEEGSKTLEMVSEGWPFVLAGLKTLLEAKKAVDFTVDPKAV